MKSGALSHYLNQRVFEGFIMSILVTGGNGFIGWRIVRELLSQGEKVVSFDSAPIRRNLEQYVDRFSYYRGDITEISQLWEAVKEFGVTRIIHMAALLPPDTEVRPAHGIKVNVEGTNNVFEVARLSGLEKVVYASSIAVYGVQEHFGDRLITENDISNPINMYGMTKAMNDFTASVYIDQYGLDLVRIRICTVFGHGRVTGMTGMIGGLMISLPAIGQPVDLPFDPGEPSPLIHAEDAAQIFVIAALSKGLSHSVYITGGHLATVGEVADVVRSNIPEAKITLGIERVPHVYLVDNSRMLSDLGYEMPSLETRITEHIEDARAEM